MRAVATKGGLYNWINTRENAFIEKHFADTELLEQTNLNEREQYICLLYTSPSPRD